MGTADGKGKQQKATPSTQARRTEFGLSSPAECADSKPASSHGTDTALIQATQCLTVSLPIAKSGKADSATSGSSASERDEVVEHTPNIYIYFISKKVTLSLPHTQRELS